MPSIITKEKTANIKLESRGRAEVEEVELTVGGKVKKKREDV